MGANVRKDRLDVTGFAILMAISLLLAVNQVTVKILGQGMQPAFSAGVRSAMAAVFVGAWLLARGRSLRLLPGTRLAAFIMGSVFALEFLCLFLALDLTTVSRTSIIFYSMPVWFALMAHVGLPGERLTPIRVLGLVLAFAGTCWALLNRGNDAGAASLEGDLLALLGAFCWAGTAFMARGSAMVRAGPEAQLFWMVLISAPILIAASFLFGPQIRDLQAVHLWILLFQAAVVVSGGFVAWLWMLSVYPASTVATFSFVTPIMGIVLGWAVMGEQVGWGVIGAATLVAVGIILINRKI